MNTIIRKVAPKDYNNLAALIQKFSEFEDGSTIGESVIISELNKLFNNSNNLLIPRIYVVEKCELLVGYAFCYPTFSSFNMKPRLFIEDLFLMENARSQGRGKQIFDFLKIEAKKIGCISLSWGCPKDNIESQKFYYAMGGKSYETLSFNIDL